MRWEIVLLITLLLCLQQPLPHLWDPSQLAGQLPTPMALSMPSSIPTPSLPPGSPMTMEACSNPGTPIDIDALQSEQDRINKLI